MNDVVTLLAADSGSQLTWNPITWLEYAVSWILVQFHAIFAIPFGESSGWSWALAIVGLVVVIRILLIPLFVKQIKAQRNLQILQPQMKEIQKKYAGDRERQSQEMMKLYKETGTNPLSSCLPIIAQAPIFFALFRVLNGSPRASRRACSPRSRWSRPRTPPSSTSRSTRPSCTRTRRPSPRPPGSSRSS